mgnify:CR=1 FL=1
MILLIEILGEMSQTPEYRLLASAGFCNASRFDQEERISEKVNFIVQNHHKDITVDVVS